MESIAIFECISTVSICLHVVAVRLAIVSDAPQVSRVASKQLFGLVSIDDRAWPMADPR